jgi:predicted acylesterase/phospholipase RssA
MPSLPTEPERSRERSPAPHRLRSGANTASSLPVRALCLPGCACRGAFQAAAVARLAARGERFDVVFGASSGSITGATTVAGLAERAPDMWRSMARTPVISARWLRSERSPFGMSRIVREALERFVPERLIRESQAELFVATAHARAWVRGALASVVRPSAMQRSLVLHSSRGPVPVHDAIMASCYIPVVYARPTRLAGELHLDGGAADNNLVEAARAHGATDITLVTPYPDGGISTTLFAPERPAVGVRGARLRVIFPAERLRQRRFDFAPEPLEEALTAREVVRVIDTTEAA